MLEFIDVLKFKFAKCYRRYKKFYFYFVALLMVLFIFRIPILKGIGNFLITESPLEKADAIFILGGNIYDRPITAKQLFDEGWSDKLVPLGANFGLDQLVWNAGNEDKCIPDALIMREFLEINKVPSEVIIPIPYGTSTKEESDTILGFSLANNYKTIIIVSDHFHLRRIDNLVTKRFEKEGIKVILRGAESSMYKKEVWWKYEQSLIMVNNEYIKLMYYFLKGY